MPRAATSRPCLEGTHQACGCSESGNHCCLTCPLPRCILDDRDTIFYARRGGLPAVLAKERGEAIAELLARGFPPTAIRKNLGLTRVQYQRAIDSRASVDSALPVEQSRRLPQPAASDCDNFANVHGAGYV